MPNTLNIPERTLAEISDSTNTINIFGPAVARTHPYQPVVCRITDHDDDDGGAADYADGMALFVSTRLGEPWKKDQNVVENIISVADADPVTNPTPSNTTVLFPNYDYSTFE